MKIFYGLGTVNVVKYVVLEDDNITSAHMDYPILMDKERTNFDFCKIVNKDISLTATILNKDLTELFISSNDISEYEEKLKSQLDSGMLSHATKHKFGNLKQSHKVTPLKNEIVVYGTIFSTIGILELITSCVEESGELPEVLVGSEVSEGLIREIIILLENLRRVYV